MNKLIKPLLLFVVITLVVVTSAIAVERGAEMSAAVKTFTVERPSAAPMDEHLVESALIEAQPAVRQKPEFSPTVWLSRQSAQPVLADADPAPVTLPERLTVVDTPEPEPELRIAPDGYPSVQPSGPVAHTEQELDEFQRLLFAEMGSDWVPDEIVLYVGSVVINRMNSDLFPDTLHDVMFQKGQYSPTWTGAIDNTPTERVKELAVWLLENGSVLPASVVFQAEFTQGDSIYHQYYDPVMKNMTYFCVKNEA